MSLNNGNIHLKLFDVKFGDFSNPPKHIEQNKLEIDGQEIELFPGESAVVEIFPNSNIFRAVEFKIGVPQEFLDKDKVQFESGNLFDGMQYFDNTKIIDGAIHFVSTLKDSNPPAQFNKSVFIALDLTFTCDKIVIRLRKK